MHGWESLFKWCMRAADKWSSLCSYQLGIYLRWNITELHPQQHNWAQQGISVSQLTHLQPQGTATLSPPTSFLTLSCYARECKLLPPNPPVALRALQETQRVVTLTTPTTPQISIFLRIKFSCGNPWLFEDITLPVRPQATPWHSWMKIIVLFFVANNVDAHFSTQM